HHEGGDQRPRHHHRDHRLRLGAPERECPVHQEAREREGDGEPHQMGEGHHPCRRLMFWRSTDCLCRKMARMIASPTAASAAATVMTKKTMMYPLAPYSWAKATKVRFTPLSIS